MPSRRFPARVSTFHDLFVLTAEYSTAEFRQRFARQARDAASRSDLIICVSSFTASQVSALLNVESARLRVVHHGVRFPARSVDTPREPLILHTGAIQKRKNLPLLIGAFEKAAPSPWRLCLAGSHGFGAAETLDRIAASPARDRIDTPGWLPDDRLAALYARASIFAFPSLDEGFGIPVLEAMAQGLPVIASGSSSLPEVCGDAALLLDPRSPDDWAHALSQLVQQDSRRAALSAAGLLHASAFTWDAAARKTWQVYCELIA